MDDGDRTPVRHVQGKRPTSLYYHSSPCFIFEYQIQILKDEEKGWRASAVVRALACTWPIPV